MGFKPLTINTAADEAAHIYAQDDAAIFQSIFGGDGVFSLGNMFKSTVLSNNKVRLSDGVLSVGGHIGRIEYGDYEDVTIENGVAGYYRNDIIYGKFLTSGDVDAYLIAVKKGTAVTSSPTDPGVIIGDVYQGAVERDYPLYRVRLEGLSIVAVEQLFEVIPTIPELVRKNAELNNALSDTALAATNIGKTLNEKVFPAIGFETDICSRLGNIREFNIGTIGRWWYCNANNGTEDLPTGEVWGFGLQLKYSVLKIAIFISGTSGKIYHSVANGDTFGEWFQH